MRNIPALDGYRGLAVLMVIAFHGQWFSFGWAGVQLFFILSSFLITSILRGQRDRPLSEYFAGFWQRRARRLFPLYYVYLLGLAGLTLLAMPAGFAGRFLGLATFTFNFAQIALAPTESFWPGHFWSLSVEVQFYLVWPFFVRFLDDRPLRRAAVAMIFGAPAVRFGGELLMTKLAAGTGSPPAPIFLLPFSHLDAFGWGAFLAMPTLRDRPGWLMAIAAGAVSLLCLPFADRQIWTFTAVTLFGAALLYAALSARFSRWFRPAWLQFSGRISYGLYVFHFGIEVWAEHKWPAAPYSLPAALRLVGVIVATYLVATASFFGWEQRFLRGGHWTTALFRRKGGSDTAP